MRTKDLSHVVLTGMTLLFLALAAAFWMDLWGRPALPGAPVAVDPQFTNTATIRMSASDLIRTGGDTSGLTCSSCHDEKKKPVSVHFNPDGTIKLPEDHKDLEMRHGRNNNCFNCHDPTNLEMLKTRDGNQLKIEESTQLCGSCHGPSLRDWQLGIHGRVSGYWDKRAGKSTRPDCTGCHDAHAPAFAPMKAAPGPAARTTGAAAAHNPPPAAPAHQEKH